MSDYPTTEHSTLHEYDDDRASTLLQDLFHSIDGDKIRLGELVVRFDRRSFGGLFLILALLCLIPGVSVAAGAIMLLPSAQLALGFSSPRFPKKIRDYQIPVIALQKWGDRVVPILFRLEEIIKPRFGHLTGSFSQRLLGLLIVVLSLVVAIPFPFSNYPPAFAVMCFSLGLLQRDGLMILIGIVISAFAIGFGYSVFYLLLDWLFA